MLNLSPLDFIMLGIPEAFLSVLIIYSLAKKRVVGKDLTIMSILFATSVFLFRALPINFGVHTILSMFILILLSIYFIKLPIVKAISYAIINMIIISLSELLHMLILVNVLKIDIAAKSSSILIKDLYVFPYLIFVGLAVIIIRKIRKLKK